MMNNKHIKVSDKHKTWFSRKEKAVPKCIDSIYPCMIKKAKNAEIWDLDDNRYIDFSGGIATMNVGHSHPKVIKAVEQQLANFQHTCFVVLPYPNYIELAEAMNNIIPGDYQKKTFFVNTGVEAVENALKAARYYNKRRGVISFCGSFHGRTHLGMSLTGKVNPYKKGFGFTSPEVYHVPFPNKISGISAQDSLMAINNLFKYSVDPESITAILVELVQGEGGFYKAPLELLVGLREICDNNGILLIVDEVQTGFARTGKFMASEHFVKDGKVVEADIVTFAKSLAAGMPLSGLTGRSEIFDKIHSGGVGSTYGGSPTAIAAALAVIEIIREEGLVERSQKLGAIAMEKLGAIKHNSIAEVRGLGSMVAIEFKDNNGIKSSDFATGVQEAAFAKGLMILVCGVDANSIRLLYPLTIEDDTFAEAMEILVESIANPSI